MDKKLITDFLEIPLGNNVERSQFFNAIDSDEVKQAALFTILNKIGNSDVESMEDKECRAALAYCKGILSVMNFSKRVLAQLEEISKIDEDDNDLAALQK